MPVKKRDGAKPRNRNENGHEKRDGKPSRDLNSARVQVREKSQDQASARPFHVAGDPGKIFAEVIHHQHAVEAVEQKCSGPIPPAALKAPEIAKRGAAPAIKAALHGKNAVELGGSEGNGDAPEEGNEGEKDERHARAGIVEDSFIAEGASGGVAVKKSEERKESDLAEMRSARERCAFVVAGFAGHRAGVQGAAS